MQLRSEMEHLTLLAQVPPPAPEPRANNASLVLMTPLSSNVLCPVMGCQVMHALNQPRKQPCHYFRRHTFRVRLKMNESNPKITDILSRAFQHETENVRCLSM